MSITNMPCSASMRHWFAVFVVLSIAACGTTERRPLPETGHYKLGKPYQIGGQWYYPEYDPSYDKQGVASWYGAAFHGRATANGEVFDRHSISAAHTTLPLPSMVEVTNLENGRQAVIRVNDRGPFVDNRIIDLSEAAARKLGFHNKGLAKVRVRFLRLAEASGTKPKPAAKAQRPSVHPAAIKPAAGPELAKATPVKPAVPLPSCRGDEHFVQVAALRDQNRAHGVGQRVQPLGPVWYEVVESRGSMIHRVRIGPLAFRRDAFDVLSRLRALGYEDAYVADCAQDRLRQS